MNLEKAKIKLQELVEIGTNLYSDDVWREAVSTVLSALEDEVELIEPQETTDNTKIEELDAVQCEPMLYNSHAIMGMIIENRNKLNEVIRKLNKENNNE